MKCSKHSREACMTCRRNAQAEWVDSSGSTFLTTMLVTEALSSDTGWNGVDSSSTYDAGAGADAGASAGGDAGSF